MLFSQIVVTVWLNAYALTATLPTIYFSSDACIKHAQFIAQHAKQGVRIEIGCVGTDKRNI